MQKMEMGTQMCLLKENRNVNLNAAHLRTIICDCDIKIKYLQKLSYSLIIDSNLKFCEFMLVDHVIGNVENALNLNEQNKSQQ